MIVKEDTSMNSTAEAIYKSVSDQRILEQCRIREDFIAHEKYQLEQLKSVTSENKSLKGENKSLKNTNKSLKNENKSLKEQLTDKDATIAALLERLAKHEQS